MKGLYSLLEQGTATLSNFLLYVILARHCGPHEFGIFTAALIMAQIIHTTAIHWSILPITTFESNSDRHLILSSVLRASFLILACPPLTVLYGLLLPIEIEPQWLAVSVSQIAFSLIFADIARFSMIRTGRISLQILSNCLRFAFSFLTLYGTQRLAFTEVNSAVAALTAGSLPPLVSIFCAVLRKDASSVSLSKGRHSDLFRASLQLGLANSAYTIVTTYAFANLGVAVFGAIQAFRSLVNWLPVVMQYLETHFAVSMTKRGTTTFFGPMWWTFFAVSLVFGTMLLRNWGSHLIAYTVGSQFLGYDSILVLMFTLTMIQSATRTMSIEVRLKGITSAIRWQRNILLIGALMMFIFSHGHEHQRSAAGLFAIMICVASLQSATMLLQMRSDRNRPGGCRTQ